MNYLTIMNSLEFRSLTDPLFFLWSVSGFVLKASFGAAQVIPEANGVAPQLDVTVTVTINPKAAKTKSQSSTAKDAKGKSELRYYTTIQHIVFMCYHILSSNYRNLHNIEYVMYVKLSVL